MTTKTMRGALPGLPLINAQYMSSDSNNSSSRLSRGLSSYNEKDSEGALEIALSDFAQLIRVTPFRKSLTSLYSTSSGQPSHGSVQGSQTEAESPTTDNQSAQNKSQTKEEPLRRALTLTKKSQFSKYDRKLTIPKDNEDD
jgi:uncharacterized membrane protein (UPF0182 family)